MLLVVSDEIPPKPFDQILEVPDFPYAVAMLLRNAGPDEPGITFARGAEEITPRQHRELLFDFLKWYHSDQPAFGAGTSLGDLVWQKQ